MAINVDIESLLQTAQSVVTAGTGENNADRIGNLFLRIISALKELDEIYRDNLLVKAQLPLWILDNMTKKPTYTAEEVGAVPSTVTIPSEITDLTINGETWTLADAPWITTDAAEEKFQHIEDNYLTRDEAEATYMMRGNYTTTAEVQEICRDIVQNYVQEETDPGVPDWAKQETKPAYTPAEIGTYSKDELDGKLAELQERGEYVTSDTLDSKITEVLNDKYYQKDEVIEMFEQILNPHGECGSAGDKIYSHIGHVLENLIVQQKVLSFQVDYAVLLHKNIDDLGPDDVTTVIEALYAYRQLPEAGQKQLEAQYNLLIAFSERLQCSTENVENFREKWNKYLILPSITLNVFETIIENNEYYEFVEDYDTLTPQEKIMLSTGEKNNCDTILHHGSLSAFRETYLNSYMSAFADTEYPVNFDEFIFTNTLSPFIKVEDYVQLAERYDELKNELGEDNLLNTLTTEERNFIQAAQTRYSDISANLKTEFLDPYHDIIEEEVDYGALSYDDAVTCRERIDTALTWLGDLGNNEYLIDEYHILTFLYKNIDTKMNNHYDDAEERVKYFLQVLYVTVANKLSVPTAEQCLDKNVQLQSDNIDAHSFDSSTRTGEIQFTQPFDVHENEFNRENVTVTEGFYGTENITKLKLPKESIGEIVPQYAFANMSSLLLIACTSAGDNILSGVKDIGHAAFAGCAALASIELPETLEEIGTEAFSGCDSLRTVTCKSVTPPEITSNTFNSVEDRTLYVPEGAQEAYANHSLWGRMFSSIEVIPADA